MNIKDSSLRSPNLLLRLASAFYDTFLVFGISCILAIIALTLKVNFGTPIAHNEVALNPLEQNLLQGLVIFSSYLFFVYFWVTHGQTLGMQTWKLKLVSNNQQKISYVQASIRFLTAIISYGFFGIGMLWCLFDKQQRSWQDITSKTSLIVDK